MRTEHELLSDLRARLGLCIRDCEMIASFPVVGPTYHHFRTELKEVEELCRQVAYYRADARWFAIPFTLAQAHKKAGDWLRGHYPRPLFLKLADNLRMLDKSVDGLQHRATGRIGMILPVERAGPLRETRPVQVLASGMQ